MNIAELSIKKKLVTLVFTTLLVVGGIICYILLGRLEDPEFTIKDAVVTTYYPGATPMEVAEEVTDKIETAIQDMPQLDELQSSNSPGLSVITVTIKDQYNMETLPQVWDELRRKVGDVQSEMPPGVMPSIVNDSFGDVFGILMAITGDGYSWREMYEYVKFLRKELLLVEGVSKIDLWGVQEEAVFVEISRSRMANLSVGLDQIYNTLEYQNLVHPAGSVRVGPRYIRIHPTGEFQTIDDIANLQIRDPETGSVIYLKDVATVTKGYVDPPGSLLRYNGKEAISVGVSVVPGGNVVDMGAAVNKRLAELEDRRPVGMEISVINDQPKDVTAAVNGFVVSFGQAVAIVVIVLLLFMGLRSGLLIGFILIITVEATFILLYLWGVNLERISLGALVIALGMLVDNAIVVTEGMMIRIQAGKDRLQAAKEVVSQNMTPLLGATVIAVLAFAAIGVSDDSTGEYCRSLFQVMLFSLMISWVIAITITPLFCTIFLKGNDKNNSEPPKDPYQGAVFMFYKKFLTGCIRFRWTTVLVLVALLVASYFMFGMLKNSFFPDSTRAQFIVNYRLPAGSDIRQTSDDMAEVENFLLKDKRVTTAAAYIGAGAPRFMLTFSPETDGDKGFGLILVGVKDYKQIDGLMVEVLDYVGSTFPDAEPTVEKISLGPGGGAVQARFSGPDPEVLRSLAEQAKTVLRTHPGAYAVRDDWKPKVNLIRPQFDETKARAAGVPRAVLNAALEMNFTGTRVGIFREDDELLPIIMRQPEAERENVDNIENVQVWSPATRKTVPVAQVVTGFKTVTEDAYVLRRDRKMTITAECDKRPGVLASIIFDDVRARIEAIEIPQGYEMQWGGEFEDSQKAQAKLAGSMPATLLFMVLIVIMLFNSLKQPAIIWLTVPLAIIGVALGLFIFDLPFDFMALLGFLSLVGMLIKGAIVLIDQININLSEGMTPYNAVMDSAVSRMRPVSMAAITTVLGMIPLLPDVFFQAMAVTIMSGLTFATILTLVVVPVLYTMFYRIPSPK